MSRLERQRLTLALCGGALMLALAAALVWMGHRAHLAAIAEHADARRVLADTNARYLRTASEEHLIRLTISRFDELLSRHIIGEERRLDWADQLRDTARRLQIPRLDFELAPRRQLAPASPDGQYQLAASRMQLRAELLHEGDLYALFDGLRLIDAVLIAPRQCQLTPLVETQTSGATLRAECTLDWLTVQPPARPETGS